MSKIEIKFGPNKYGDWGQKTPTGWQDEFFGIIQAYGTIENFPWYFRAKENLWELNVVFVGECPIDPTNRSIKFWRYSNDYLEDNFDVESIKGAEVEKLIIETLQQWPSKGWMGEL